MHVVVESYDEYTGMNNFRGEGGRRRSSLDFGDERRRATDTLLVLNCFVWMLQLLSKGALTFWGAKVGIPISF